MPKSNMNRIFIGRDKCPKSKAAEMGALQLQLQFGRGREDNDKAMLTGQTKTMHGFFVLIT
jgi:hypothetical protein